MKQSADSPRDSMRGVPTARARLLPRRALLRLSVLAIAAGVVPVAAGAAGAPGASPQTAASEATPTVLVTGANRGIGLALARAYAARGWKVIGTARKPAEATELQALAASDRDVSVEALDVTDHAQVDALAARLKGRPIDLLINNAGITGNIGSQVFGRLDYEVAREVFATNAIAPMKVSEALLPNLVAGQQKKLVTISSSEGSIGEVNAGRLYWYRASKAAVNMEMRNLAFAVNKDGIAVALVNPGPVATDMMKGARMPLQPVDEAAAKVIRQIDQLTLEKTARFWDYNGGELPW
jgi:NAD(P)-dependent dehydrogenase (short-subunit alcohol dehydrogenase family)